MPQRKWNREKVISTIKQMHKAGSRLDHNFVQKNHRNLLNAAMRHIGKWKDAIEASGIDYSSVRLYAEPMEWSALIIIQRIKELVASHLPVYSNYVQINHSRLYNAAMKYYGSWGAAVEAAGFDYKKIRRKKHEPITLERIILEIQSRAKSGKHMGGGTVCKEDRGLYGRTQSFFKGSDPWKQALRSAGIDPDSIPNPREIWTKETILRTVRNRHASGAPLYGFYLDQNGFGGLTEAGKRVFGSWKATIEAAGLDFNDIRAVRRDYWSTEIVIQEIKDYAAKGKKLSFKSTQTERADLMNAAIRLFGSWNRAVTAAGFNYLKHTKSRSTKSWLNQLSQRDYESLMNRGRTRHVKTYRAKKRKKEQKNGQPDTPSKRHHYITN